MVTESPPVSPSVVAAILMIQKTNVTSGTLLKPTSAFLFISCLDVAFVALLFSYRYSHESQRRYPKPSFRFKQLFMNRK